MAPVSLAQAPPEDQVSAAREFVELEALAHGLPPELGADLLIRLSAVPGVGTTARRATLEDAFRMGDQARRRFPVVYLGKNGDTRAGYSQFASDLRLDALSLQSRAIDALVAISPDHAVRLMLEIRWPELPAVKCNSAGAPDVSVYFDVLGKAASLQESPDQRTRDNLREVVRRSVSRVSTNSEAMAAARLLVKLRADPARFSELIGAYGAAIANAPGEFRSFSHFVRKGSDNHYALMLRASTLDGGSTALAKAIREYLVSNINSEQCEDGGDAQQFSGTTVNSKTATKGEGTSVDLDGIAGVESFNRQICAIPKLGEGVPKITAEDLKPRKRGGGMDDIPYWRTVSANRLLMQIRKLSSNRPAAGSDSKEKEDWENGVWSFLKSIDDWKPADERSVTDYYHQKAVLSMKAVEITDGTLRDLFLTEIVHHIERFYDEVEDKPEWFSHVAPVLEGLHQEPAKGNVVLERCLRSSNSVLAAYSRFYTTLGRKK